MFNISLRNIFTNPLAWLGLWLMIAVSLVWIAGTVTTIVDDLRQPLSMILAAG